MSKRPKPSEQLAALYATLPRLECKRFCQEGCGPVLMSSLEWRRICDRLGYVPQARLDLRCPMLEEGGACSVYALRPIICRLWGLVPKLACPHGCVPERWLTDAEAYALLEEAEVIAGDRPRSATPEKLTIIR